jgi:hypothetical protein
MAMLKTATGALNPVVHCVSTISHCMKAVRLLQQSDAKTALAATKPFCLSLYRLRKNGFDRTAVPEKPLMLPPFVKLQIEARAWAKQQERQTKQPFQSPF